MLWSIVPEDTVFWGFEEAAPQFVEHELDSCPCRLRRLADGGFSVEAVCSTDPRDFLRRGLQPGRRIFLPK